MRPLSLKLREQPGTWLDLSALVPDRLTGRSVEKIKRMRLRVGRRSRAVADLFDVSGRDTETIRISGGCELLTGIGRNMTHGQIHVDGHAGQYLGRGMSGGRITVEGDAGDYAAAEMAGGILEISGDAGAHAGAATAGAPHGMSEGTVVISGNAGPRLGDRMRRGTILVFGSTGAFAGSRMIAGTLLVMGPVGGGTGYGMRRGTIILGKRPTSMLASFSSCGVLKMEFLRMLFKQLAALDRRYTLFRGFGPEVHRYAGDGAAGGKGEILVLLNAPWERPA